MVAIKLKSRVNKQVDESNYEIKTDNYNIFEKAKTRSFSAEIENDIQKSKMLLERASQAESMQADQAIIEQEEKSAAVYKRALLLIGGCFRFPLTPVILFRCSRMIIAILAFITSNPYP